MSNELTLTQLCTVQWMSLETTLTLTYMHESKHKPKRKCLYVQALAQVPSRIGRPDFLLLIGISLMEIILNCQEKELEIRENGLAELGDRARGISERETIEKERESETNS